MTELSVEKDNNPALDVLWLCMVTGTVGSIEQSPQGLVSELNALIAKRSKEDFPKENVKKAVRDMLRTGGFKPAGRQKPASEYLVQTARENRFPFINGPVDCNNILSLETGLPISLLDTDSFDGKAILKICKSGESYVFNASGQEMDLEALLCVCDGKKVPMGNPVKDSMRAKLTEKTRNLAGFIYAPKSLYSYEQIEEVGQRFASLLRSYCSSSDAKLSAIV